MRGRMARMPEDKPNPPRETTGKPLSLHGMTPEEAIQRAFGVNLPTFLVGDRVQVVESKDDTIRGATGVIMPRKPYDSAAFYWVQFDTPIPQPNDCFSISGEFRAMDLRRT
jgi:hypothetical protein